MPCACWLLDPPATIPPALPTVVSMQWLKKQKIKPKPAKRGYYNSKPKKQQPRREHPPTYYELHARNRYEEQERHYRADRYWYGDQEDARPTQSQRSSQQALSRKASPQQHKQRDSSSKAVVPPARPGSSSSSRAAPVKNDAGSKPGLDRIRHSGSSPSFDRTRQLGATGTTHLYGKHSKPMAKTTSTLAPADAAKVKQMSQAAASILGDKGWRVIAIDKPEDIEWLKAGVSAYNKNHAKPMYLLAWSPQ